MCGHRLPRPYRADFFRRIVTDGKNEIELRRVRLGEFVPALAAQALGRKACSLEPAERLRPNFPRRMAAGAIRRESGFAFEVENGLGHDRSRRISRTEKQDVVVVFHSDSCIIRASELSTWQLAFSTW